MSEVLIFSDIHAHCHKKKTERLEDCLKALDWVFSVARDRKIKNILFGGDFFHDRQKIEVYTYQRAFETLKNNLDGSIQLWLLLGNHDLWFNEKTSISSVVPFSTLPGVKIIDRPIREKIENSYWDFIPFTHDPISWVQEFKTQLPGKTQYCLGHIALDGAVLHGNTLSDVVVEHDGDMVKVNADLFSHYENVFLGHYHAEQKITDRIEYIGSPLELSFGEAFQKKHIIVFNTETREKEYIENTISPKHLILYEKDLSKHDLKGNFVQLVVDEIGSTDLIQMRKEITTNNQLGSFEVRQRQKKMDEHMIQDAKAILFKEDEMLTRYVDEVGTEKLDRDILLKIGKDICEKAMDN